MFLATNKGKCVICLGDKDIIPGGDPVELTDEEINHPDIKAHKKAGDLELVEVDEPEGVNEDQTADPANPAKEIADNAKKGK
jgi:hypothetical protein